MNYAWRTFLRCLWVVVASLALLGFVGATLGCAPATYTAPELGVHEPLTFAQLLEVERNVLAGRHDLNARRTAHLMGQQVGGGSSDSTIRLDDPSAPEGYTVDGRPGKMPWHFHMGYAAHRVIAEHYRTLHPNNDVFINHTSITTIVDKAGGELAFVRPYEADLRPDIADVKFKVVFEIKPHGDQNLTEGKKKVDQYLGAINVAMVGKTPFTHGMGYKGELGVRFKDGESPWNIQWDTTAPGVVQYQWRKLNPAEESEKGYRDAYEQGRWRDLTAQEMQAHARELHEAVEFVLRNREMLGQVRAGATMPILLVGTMADFVLSAALWESMSGPPRLLPVVRKAPPPPHVRSSPLNVFVGRIQPAQSPAVNARSLGSDAHGPPTGPVRPALKPAAPRKTDSGSTHPN